MRDSSSATLVAEPVAIKPETKELIENQLLILHGLGDLARKDRPKQQKSKATRSQAFLQRIIRLLKPLAGSGCTISAMANVNQHSLVIAVQKEEAEGQVGAVLISRNTLANNNEETSIREMQITSDVQLSELKLDSNTCLRQDNPFSHPDLLEYLGALVRLTMSYHNAPGKLQDKIKARILQDQIKARILQFVLVGFTTKLHSKFARISKLDSGMKKREVDLLFCLTNEQLHAAVEPEEFEKAMKKAPGFASKAQVITEEWDKFVGDKMRSKSAITHQTCSKLLATMKQGDSSDVSHDIVTVHNYVQLILHSMIWLVAQLSDLREGALKKTNQEKQQRESVKSAKHAQNRGIKSGSDSQQERDRDPKGNIQSEKAPTLAEETQEFSSPLVWLMGSLSIGNGLLKEYAKTQQKAFYDSNNVVAKRQRDGTNVISKDDSLQNDQATNDESQDIDKNEEDDVGDDECDPNDPVGYIFLSRLLQPYLDTVKMIEARVPPELKIGVLTMQHGESLKHNTEIENTLESLGVHNHKKMMERLREKLKTHTASIHCEVQLACLLRWKITHDERSRPPGCADDILDKFPAHCDLFETTKVSCMACHEYLTVVGLKFQPSQFQVPHRSSEWFPCTFPPFMLEQDGQDYSARLTMCIREADEKISKEDENARARGHSIASSVESTGIDSEPAIIPLDDDDDEIKHYFS